VADRRNYRTVAIFCTSTATQIKHQTSEKTDRQSPCTVLYNLQRARHNSQPITMRIACYMALAASASAFVMPQSGRASVQLEALQRRDVLGWAFGGLVSAGLAQAAEAAANPALQTFKGSKGPKGSFIPGKGIRKLDDSLIAAQNPALQTFKGGKKTKGSFIPGKGIRAHDDEQLIASNPALETFKGRKKTKGSFIPGKGIRVHDDGEQLIASNPALETFKGRKMTKGSFIPGKGIRAHDDELLIASNPALETFKGRKMTKGSFIPGKGIRRIESVV
jgi:hypothetical protein